MLGSRRVFLSTAGRNLIGWPCHVTGAKHRPVCRWGPLGFQEMPSEKYVTNCTDKAYTAQQKNRILNFLNMASKSELDGVEELQGQKAASIVQHREEYGPFRDLNTLCDLQHFQGTPLHHVCDSMLSLSTKSKPVRFLHPQIPVRRLQKAQSIVSIVFGVKKTAWAHLDCNMIVRDWQQRNFFSFIKGKHMPDLYLQEISSVVSQLPQADLYILQKLSLSSQKSSLLPVLVHLHTVEAMLYCLLNPRLSEVEQMQRVFSMHRHTVGRHFQIMVEDFRVSGVEVVHRLVEEAVNEQNPRVTFPSELVQKYRDQLQIRGQNRNEELCDALLQAVTTYELAHLY